MIFEITERIGIDGVTAGSYSDRSNGFLVQIYPNLVMGLDSISNSGLDTSLTE
jgi:hypothetical protein